MRVSKSKNICVCEKEPKTEPLRVPRVCALNRTLASPALFPPVRIKNIAHRKNLDPLITTLCAFNININNALQSIVLAYLRSHVLGAAERT